MKAVLDTNVLVSALIAPSGTPAQLLNRADAFTLVTAEALLTELECVLNYDHLVNRYGLTEKITSDYLAHLRDAAHLVSIEREISVVKDDPDDDLFIACALSAGAPYLVSGDKHLLTLGSYEAVEILTPAAFLRILDEEEGEIDSRS